MTFDWQAGVVVVAAIILTTQLGTFLAFKVPALHRMREINREQDALKKTKKRFRAGIKASMQVGLATNLIFFLLLVPFVVTLEAKPAWRYVTDVVLVLLTFDFFYYLVHRGLLHGVPYFKRIHALHHEVRKPTHVDAFYVHPLETFIGQAIFMGSVIGLGALVGPFHVGSVAAAYLLYVQLNLINHTYVDLPYFPFKTLNWITTKHAIHHLDMNKGNYATITMIYDYMFGTLE